MLFAPCLVCQTGGPALPDHVQPVLQFHLLIRSEIGNVHVYSPLPEFRVLGVNTKNSNLKFTGERRIFHYTFLFDAYLCRILYHIFPLAKLFLLHKCPVYLICHGNLTDSAFCLWSADKIFHPRSARRSICRFWGMNSSPPLRPATGYDRVKK